MRRNNITPTLPGSHTIGALPPEGDSVTDTDTIEPAQAALLRRLEARNDRLQEALQDRKSVV